MNNCTSRNHISVPVTLVAQCVNHSSYFTQVILYNESRLLKSCKCISSKIQPILLTFLKFSLLLSNKQTNFLSNKTWTFRSMDEEYCLSYCLYTKKAKLKDLFSATLDVHWERTRELEYCQCHCLSYSKTKGSMSNIYSTCALHCILLADNTNLTEYAVGTGEI